MDSNGNNNRGEKRRNKNITALKKVVLCQALK
jgi:hypothetical protein